MKLVQELERISGEVLTVRCKFGPIQRPTVLAHAWLQWKILGIHLSHTTRIQDFLAFEGM